MKNRRSRGAIIAIVVVALIAGLIYAFQNSVARFALVKGLGAATGTTVSVGSLSMHGDRAVLRNVRISARNGERLALLPRVDVTYDLHDLLPGSRHRYGLRSLTVYDPRITVVRNLDGTYNLPHLPAAKGPARPAAPLDFRMRVVNGSLALIDKSTPAAAPVTIRGVNVAAAVNTAGRTHYTATMAYDENGVRYPISGRGTIDHGLGLNYQHWTAAHVPLPQLVNYALHTPAIRLQAGVLDDLNARYYGKLSVTASLRGGRVAMRGVSAPIENVHGPIDVTSAGLTTEHIDASIAGAPIRVNGGIYDLSHPRLRLVVHAHGEVARLKHLTAAAARLPVSGRLDLAVLAEGPVRAPVAFILMHAPQIRYRAMPLRDPNGLLAFDGHTATVVNFGVRYGGFSLGARGRMSLRKEPNALEAVAVLSGPADELPYASSILPPMTLNGTVLATANSLEHVDTRGVLRGSGSGAALASIFAIGNAGTGSALMRFRAPGESLNAKVALDRPHSSMSALMHARNVSLHPASAAPLPGLPVKTLPAIAGTFTGDVFASRSGNMLGLLGSVALRGVRYGTFRIADAHARFSGSPGEVRVASLTANGNFGTLSARGTIAGTNRVALTGHYTGSLAQAASLAGNLPARGYVDAPIALLYANGRTIAQVQNARFTGASVRGVPIENASATVALRGKAVDVYAARAQIEHTGSALASGSIGNGGTLAFTLSGFPVAGGYADAAATASGSLRSPDARGTALLTGAHYLRYPVSGASTFRYASGTASIRDAIVSAGPALVAADGTVWPRYDLAATASGAIAYAQFEGRIDAGLRVRGSGKTPVFSGYLDAPEGEVHGLAFRNMRAAVAGTPAGVAIRGGTVAVGSTALAFSAGIAPGALQASISAPHANLADFNDYFDTGDTLAGTGGVAMSVDMTPFTLASTGNLNLQNVRYRRFEIGRTVADWSTSGRSTSLTASVGGTRGTLNVSGTVTPRSKTVDVHATASNVDLRSWLPLLGYTTPVTGYVDATAALRGNYPDIAMNANASLRDGTVGRVRINRAQVAATAVRGRGRITRAIVQIPYLTASGSGTFGLHKTDPLALTVNAASPDVGRLLASFSGQPNRIAGILNATLRVNGTASDPRAVSALSIAQLRYAKLTIPRAQAALSADRHRVALTQAAIMLPKGSVTASGSAPLPRTPTAPISLALSANSVNLADFAGALPSGSRVAGLLNGALRVGGTMQAPVLHGSMALQNGYYAGPMDQNPISGARAQMVFSGTQIALNGVHANVGGGTFDMSGTASVPTLRDVRALTFDSTIRANNAQVNNPQYFRGKFDANVHAYRTAGGLPTITGSVDVPSARIPLTAFWNPHAPKQRKRAPLNLAFDLTARAGHDVRVQSTNVDVGAQGAVRVTGTLRKPMLSGRVASTGGTVDFFRRFTIRRADVAFNPSDGFWPYINAVADTQVGNPLTYIQLRVAGLAPNDMHLGLQSDPAYDRSQILALLAGLQSVGAVPGVAASGTNGFTLGGAVQNLALGQLDNLFTRDIFEPLDAGLGSALGLQNLQISDSFTSGFGVSAVKAFGKHLTAVFAENLGEPREQSLTIEAHHGERTAFDLMFYNVQDPPLTGFLSQTTNPFKFSSLNNNTLLTPVTGTNGFTLTLQHKFD